VVGKCICFIHQDEERERKSEKEKLKGCQKSNKQHTKNGKEKEK